jgi:hypothetical protein
VFHLNKVSKAASAGSLLFAISFFSESTAFNGIALQLGGMFLQPAYQYECHLQQITRTSVSVEITSHSIDACVFAQSSYVDKYIDQRRRSGARKTYVITADNFLVTVYYEPSG